MSPILVLILFCNISHLFCDGYHIPDQHLKIEKRRIPVGFDNKNNTNSTQNAPVPKQDAKKDPVIINIPVEQENNQQNEPIKSKPAEKVEIVKKTTTVENTSKTATNEVQQKIKTTEMESGALLRGVLVFVGFSVLFIMYLAFKTYYRKRNSQAPMVRKYGVRTRRSDIEMTPLPLSDDEEDETLFELTGSSSR